MNEKIKQLVKQAVIAVDNPFPGNSLNDELKKMYIPDCFAEKFAELIVQECASIVYKTCQDGDAGAQAILYEFDIDNARSQK